MTEEGPKQPSFKDVIGTDKYQALSLVLDKPNYFFVDNQGYHFPTIPDLFVKTGNDLRKLIVTSPSLGLFAKIYSKPEHAAFIETTHPQIVQAIHQSYPRLYLEQVVASQGRIVVLNFVDNLHSLQPKSSTAFIVFQKLLKNVNKGHLIRFLGIPSESQIFKESSNVTYYSDLVSDSWSELENFCK